ncbi:MULTISPECIES: hypothetical protein [unclassified Pseudomonas]|uniref:hypothetical protein n=1 Tax=unclassified Pseudomonas TaxID=196821 RepID=UPI00111C16E2|nr:MULTISPECIES: hypothetical protein [unclassified Pseudomonas]
MKVGKLKGVDVVNGDEYLICKVDFFSEDLEASIRRNLSRICNGAEQSKSASRMYSYSTTLSCFFSRYENKADTTKKGMLGELLTHILAIELFSGFETISPYFNLEEKSIRKGFDLLLFDPGESAVWITEVKSGHLHKDKDQTQTTQELLAAARNDLNVRLNENELNHWQNAIHAARVAVEGVKDYKSAVISILENRGECVLDKRASSKDNSVILVATLFHDVSQPVDVEKVKEISINLAAKKMFKRFVLVSIQKNTIEKIEDFLKREALNNA